MNIITTDAGHQFGTGWLNRPTDVWQAVKLIEGSGAKARFRDAAPNLMPLESDGGNAVLWLAEKQVRGSLMPSWNQGSVGSCVGFGTTRAVQDLLYVEVAAGEPEQYPGADLCPEITYAGSRVEIGGGQIGGDGSIGAWAARFVKEYGVVKRGVYGSLDLTSYNESQCRSLGNSGVPSNVEAEAKLHPVTAVALVQTGAEGWAAIQAGKPIAVCSNQGFTTTLKNGFCEPSGQWAHCMEVRAAITTKFRSKAFVIQNSWGGYLGGDRKVELADGSTLELPEGCFCADYDVVASMLSQGDSWAFAGLTGWRANKLTWIP